MGLPIKNCGRSDEHEPHEHQHVTIGRCSGMLACGRKIHAEHQTWDEERIACPGVGKEGK